MLFLKVVTVMMKTTSRVTAGKAVIEETNEITMVRIIAQGLGGVGVNIVCNIYAIFCY